MEREYRGLGREVELASRDPGLGLTGGQIDNPWASLKLMEKHDRIRAASMPYRARREAMWAATEPYRARREAMWAATEPYHGSWQGPIRRMETAINRYYHVTYPHMTALAANLADQYHHEYAMLMIEQKGLAMMGYLPGSLHTVCFFDTPCVEACREGASRRAARDCFVRWDVKQVEFCLLAPTATSKVRFV